mmetsp:Transcript_19079/g.72121  ORF Transcript_19079/g.72121 Transcript_19079/m.72121 type:complete len:91 (+) Transcript_19079:6130-6402(+)
MPDHVGVGQAIGVRGEQAARSAHGHAEAQARSFGHARSFALPNGFAQIVVKSLRRPRVSRETAPKGTQSCTQERPATSAATAMAPLAGER